MRNFGGYNDMQGILISGIFTVLFCVLSGMGAGGGGLFTAYLSIFTDVGQLTAQGIGAAVFIVSAVSSSLFNLKKRRINYSVCLFLSLCACAGAIPGALLATCMPRRLMRLLFGGFLIATSALCFCKKRK